MCSTFKATPAGGPVAASGIDSSPAGWVCVLSTGSENLVCALPDLSALPRLHSDSALAIDIPIGLPSQPPGRTCDRLARRMLGPRRGTSVFPAPARQTLDAHSFPDALRRSREALGTGLTKQAFNILPKIRQADNAARSHNLKEVHPELSFYAMNNNTPVLEPKRTADGRRIRAELLDRHGLGWVLDHLGTCKRELGANPDDLLDAAAACWTAQRIIANAAHRLPEHPEHDSTGLPMEMWY